MTVYVQETWASLGLGERLSDTINYQDLMRVNTQDLQIVEINKDLIERENKENSRQEIRGSSGPGCFLSPQQYFCRTFFNVVLTSNFSLEVFKLSGRHESSSEITSFDLFVTEDEQI